MARISRVSVRVNSVPTPISDLNMAGGGACTALVTALVLDDTTGISNGDTIRIGTEDITVTTVANGTSLSVVVRGVNSTVAAIHADESPVYNVTPGKCSGTAVSDRPIIGEVLSVYLKFSASSPATVDTTVATQGEATGLPVANLLVTTNVNTSAAFAPRLPAVNAANSAITNSGVPMAVADNVTVAIAGCDVDITDAVIATIVFLDRSK
jgi:hypothetical protein